LRPCCGRRWRNGRVWGCAGVRARRFRRDGRRLDRLEAVPLALQVEALA
jgi:hypothetical protein